jgi:mevalonate kinase
MKQATAYVRGKVLLSGEHVVVHGKPALVAAIDKGIEVKIKTYKGFELNSTHRDGLGLVKEAFRVARIEPNNMRITITSTLPVGSGMGSSAALCAAVIEAGAEFIGKTLTKKEWYELTWQAEKKAHGNSSGVDPAAVVYGGLLWYVRGKEMEQVKAGSTYPLLLVQTGKPVESTGEMVEAVASRYEVLSTKYEVLFKNIGEVTKLMRRAMVEGRKIKDLVDENGMLLEELGVVGKKAIQLSERLRQLGCGVKVAGAGGVKEGSGMIIVCHEELDTIQAQINRLGV